MLPHFMVIHPIVVEIFQSESHADSPAYAATSDLFNSQISALQIQYCSGSTGYDTRVCCLINRTKLL